MCIRDRDNVILELNDDAPESKLLGIQIDIDLEDKSKVTDCLLYTSQEKKWIGYKK